MARLTHHFCWSLPLLLAILFSKGLGLQDEVQIVVVCHGGDDSSASGAL